MTVAILPATTGHPASAAGRSVMGWVKRPHSEFARGSWPQTALNSTILFYKNIYLPYGAMEFMQPARGEGRTAQAVHSCARSLDSSPHDAP
jgi:hypothetical protein